MMENGEERHHANPEIDQIDSNDGYTGEQHEMVTETVDDQYTYDEEDYYRSSIQHQTINSGSKNPNNITGGPMDLQVSNTQELLGQSFLSKTGDDQQAMQFESGDMASNLALGKLKARIKQKEAAREHVDPDEVVENYKRNQMEKRPLDIERLDMFFHENQFLKSF